MREREREGERERKNKDTVVEGESDIRREREEGHSTPLSSCLQIPATIA